MRSGRSENQWMTQGLDLLEQRHVRHCGPEMCDWYKELRAFILGQEMTLRHSLTPLHGARRFDDEWARKRERSPGSTAVRA